MRTAGRVADVSLRFAVQSFVPSGGSLELTFPAGHSGWDLSAAAPDGGDDIDGDGMTVWTREPPDGWSF